MSTYKIVIDGGPCGGKTTIMSFLQQKLADLGYHVIVVNEQATELITAGLGPDILGGKVFQQTLLRRMTEKEDFYSKLASQLNHKKTVILCDRGAMSGAAYTTPAEFDALLIEEGYSRVDLRDNRYDGVLFFRSVAVDKPELYTVTNNPARKDTIEEAIALDSKTEGAWNGCEHMWIIGNQTDMHGKSLKALRAICRILGIPQPLEVEMKYSVSERFNISHILNYPSAVRVNIVQDYLLNKNSGSERVRARSQGGGTAYYHTIKEDVSPGIRLEYQTRISSAEYANLLRRADSRFARIEKERTCFVYEDQYFEFDMFNPPFHKRYLEVELTDETTHVIMPGFLQGYITNVTGMHHHSNAEIARNAAKHQLK